MEFELRRSTKLPYFKAPDGMDNQEYLREAVLRRAWHRRYPGKVTDALSGASGIRDERHQDDGLYRLLPHRLRLHQLCQEPGIFRWARAGAPARAAWSAYCMGITDIDPMQLQPALRTLPQPGAGLACPTSTSTSATSAARRSSTTSVEKYGADHVAQIVTFGTMAARGAVRDVGRAHGHALSGRGSRWPSSSPWSCNMTLDKALEVSPRPAEACTRATSRCTNSSTPPEAWRACPAMPPPTRPAWSLPGSRCTDYVPLAKNDEPVGHPVQHDRRSSDLGLLKMDFLGLRTLTVIHDTEMAVRRTRPGFPRWPTLTTTTSRTYDMLTQRRDRWACSSLNLPACARCCMSLRPRNLEDVIAVISLYRPGPMDSIPTYMRNRQDPYKVTYKTPAAGPHPGCDQRRASFIRSRSCRSAGSWQATQLRPGRQWCAAP